MIDRPIEIAEYQSSLLGELVPMWRASFEPGVGVIDPHPIAEQEEFFLTQVLPCNAVRVALSEGQLVGFVAASTESVAQLYVRKGFQRRGIGSELLQLDKGHVGRSFVAVYVCAKSCGLRLLRKTRLCRRGSRLRAVVAA